MGGAAARRGRRARGHALRPLGARRGARARGARRCRRRDRGAGGPRARRERSAAARLGDLRSSRARARSACSRLGRPHDPRADDPSLSGQRRGGLRGGLQRGRALARARPPVPADPGPRASRDAGQRARAP